jgi:dipeptidase E
MSQDRHILAMGGGGFSMEPDNLAQDRYAIRLTRKPRPKVCFLPTASGDPDGYTERFHKAFSSLDCPSAHLHLFRPHTKDIEGFILEQDLIYVGGGNTRNMIVLWREWGLDAMIRKAYEEGTVLAGLSAGANCWFEEFSTDSMGDLMPWPGLGWLSGSFCPHYDGEVERRPSLRKMITEGRMGAGYAADDGAAVHFVNEKPYQFVSSRENAKVYAVGMQGSDFFEAVQETTWLDEIDINI